MIVDSSAIIAIILEEPGTDDIWSALSGAGTIRISAASMLETWMVLDRRATPHGHDLFTHFLAIAAPIVEPVTIDHAKIAREAWARYGKGSGHPAQLNFGDCLAYALAKQSGESLLFIGNDFIHTDVTSAIPR